jgi:hypothetical protein
MTHGFFGLVHHASRFSFIPLLGNTANGYEAEAAKLEMIINYFRRVTSMNDSERDTFNKQFIVYERKHLMQTPSWREQRELSLSAFEIVTERLITNDDDDNNTNNNNNNNNEDFDEEATIETLPAGIEHCHGTAQADFANKYIGGGALSGGCVQEEIRFAISPECLVSLLFNEVMGDRDAIVIRGAEQFSEYEGYGRRLRFGGNYIDRNVVDEDNVLKITIVSDGILKCLDIFVF